MYHSAANDGLTTKVGALSFDIRRATPGQIRPLRLDVLRHGMANQTVDFDGDDAPTTLHLAAFDRHDRVVATSTWLDRPSPSGEPGVQLRGMATRRTLQGTGLGARLLTAGIDEARRRGAALVWANARDAALEFYSANGFRVVGEGFVESVTQLPHHVVEYHIS
jgi:predicted GNAT family N-acyltransferase